MGVGGVEDETPRTEVNTEFVFDLPRGCLMSKNQLEASSLPTYQTSLIVEIRMRFYKNQVRFIYV